MPKNLSPAMLQALENLANGKPSDDGLPTTNSHAGGHAWTLDALGRRGFVRFGRDFGITDAGLRAIGRTPKTEGE